MGFIEGELLLKKAEAVSILPLVDQLSFIKNKKYWGYAFRYGHFEIPEVDFKLIADNMLTT